MNARNKYGFTALILAAGMGNFEIVKMLTRAIRVDVNIVEGNSCTALMIACMHGFCDVASEILLRDDCDVNIGKLSFESGQKLFYTLFNYSVQLWIHMPDYCMLQEPSSDCGSVVGQGRCQPKLD